MQVTATTYFDDIEEGVERKAGEKFTTSEHRAKFLKDKGLVTYTEKPKEKKTEEPVHEKKEIHATTTEKKEITEP